MSDNKDNQKILIRDHGEPFPTNTLSDKKALEDLKKKAINSSLLSVLITIAVFFIMPKESILLKINVFVFSFCFSSVLIYAYFKRAKELKTLSDKHQ